MSNPPIPGPLTSNPPGPVPPGSNPLTAEQIRSFQANGYLIERGLATAAEIAAFREIAERDLSVQKRPLEYEADVDYPGSPPSRDAAGGDTVRRLLQAYSRGEVLADWAQDRRITDRLKILFGSKNIRLVQSHHNCIMTKHPRFSSETHWHQDIRYWRFQRSELVSVWLALGYEQQANGSILILPGTHAMHFDRQRFDGSLFFREDLAENQSLIEQAVVAELKPGDTLFFHAALLHAAGRNCTDTAKLALVYTYRPEDNPPLPDSKSTRLPEVPL